jgi:hypothetical protein
MWIWTNKLVIIGGLTLLVLSAAPEIGAQIVYGQPTSGSAQMMYYHWKTTSGGEESTVNQLMVPLTGFVPVQDNFEMMFYVANSSNSYDVGDGTYKLNGLGDFLLQASHSFADDRLLASATLNLPIGKKELNGEQTEVLFALSQNYLEFPMRQFGGGFGFSLLLGGALELKEDMRAGAGVAYQYVGSYTPYEGARTLDTVTEVDYSGYDPGDFISANGGIDYQRGRMLWSGDLIYSFYLADKLDGEKAFRQSRQFDWRLRCDYTGERNSFAAMLRYVWRGHNRVYSDAGFVTPKLFGNEFTVLAEYTQLIGQQWFAAPSADFRIIAGSEITTEIGSGSSNVLGFGASVGRHLTEQLSASLGVKFYTGSAYDGDLDISGYRISLGLTGAL